jgi:hypothetical protein
MGHWQESTMLNRYTHAPGVLGDARTEAADHATPMGY